MNSVFGTYTVGPLVLSCGVGTRSWFVRHLFPELVGLGAPLGRVVGCMAGVWGGGFGPYGRSHSAPR